MIERHSSMGEHTSSGKISNGGTTVILASPARISPPPSSKPTTSPKAPSQTVLKKQLPVTSLHPIALLMSRGMPFCSVTALMSAVDSLAAPVSASSLLNGITVTPTLVRDSLDCLVSTMDAMWL